MVMSIFSEEWGALVALNGAVIWRWLVCCLFFDASPDGIRQMSNGNTIAKSWEVRCDELTFI